MMIPFMPSLILVALLSAGLFFWPSGQAWTYSHGSFRLSPLPVVRYPITDLQQADLNGDGNSEELRLVGQQARIDSLGKAVWISPPEWKVKQVALADLNRDGRLEAVLLLWRPFRPWPVDRILPYGGRIQSFQSADGESCHLILIGWKKGSFRELWAGSAMAEPLKTFAADDINGDGFQELVATESSYSDPPGGPANALTAWEWNGFGFSVLARSIGNFQDMQIVHTEEGDTLILTH